MELKNGYKKLMKKQCHNLINQIKKEFKKLDKKYPILMGILYAFIGLLIVIIPMIIIYLAIVWLIGILT